MKKKVLIARLDAIGDFIIWLGSAKYLWEYYQENGHKVVLLVNKKSKDLAEVYSYWDDVILWDETRYQKSFFYRWGFRIKLFLGEYDIAINTVYSRIFIQDKLFTFIRAKEKIAFSRSGNAENKRLDQKIYSTLIDVDDKIKHELHHQLDLYKVLGITNSKINLADFDRLLFNKYTYNLKKYFVIVPGAGAIYRQWDVNKYFQLIDLVKNTYSLKSVICGAESETNLGECIQKKCSGCVNLVGKTSLLEMIALIKNADFILTNETSAVHIAAATKTPCVCILGGGHFGRFVPYPDELETKVECVYNRMDCYNCNWNCKLQDDNKRPYPCISSVTVDQVMEKVDKILTTNYTDYTNKCFFIFYQKLKKRVINIKNLASQYSPPSTFNIQHFNNLAVCETNKGNKLGKI